MKRPKSTPAPPSPSTIPSWLLVTGSKRSDLRPEDYRLYRYLVTKDGLNFAVYRDRAECQQDIDSLKERFWEHTWKMIDREAPKGGNIK